MAAPTFLNPDHLHATGGYSHAAKVSGSLLIVSGQVGLDKDRKVVGADDFEAQATQAFRNLIEVLKAGGAEPKHVVRLGVILTDRKNLVAYREVRSRFFAAPMPASTLIIAGLVMPELTVEVEAIAQLPA